MESTVNIRARDKDINEVFMNDEIIWIKFMSKKKEGLWECSIRHCELPFSIEKRTYTIKGLRNLLIKFERRN